MAVGRFDSAGYISIMTVADLKNLLERVQAWPEEAQNELVAAATQIERELRNDDYTATQEELQVIDDAMASLDAGESATDLEIATALAKFRKE
jgi:ATP-dependent protease HslVU (ClpYQ) peptidase subunit